MPLDESTLPEPDWTKKPIVIITGDAPDNDEYRRLHTFLRNQLLDDAIEVVWTNHNKESKLVFSPEDAKRHLGKRPITESFVPLLDFDFADTGNPGIQRRIDDPELAGLTATSGLGNPPVLFLNLHGLTDTLHFHPSLLYAEGRAAHLLHAPPFEMTPRIHSDQFIFLTHSFPMRFSGTGISSPFGQIEFPIYDYDIDLVKELFNSDEFRDLQLKTKASSGSWSAINLSEEEYCVIERAFARLEKQAAGNTSKRIELGDDRPAIIDQIILGKLSNWSTYHLLEKEISRGDTTSDKIRLPKSAPTISAITHFAEAFLTRARKKKLEMLQGIDPERIPVALREEIRMLENGKVRAEEELREVRREVADGRQELSGVEKAIDDQMAVLRAERKELDALRVGLTEQATRLELKIPEIVDTATGFIRYAATLDSRLRLLDDAAKLKGRAGRKARKEQRTLRRSVSDYFIDKDFSKLKDLATSIRIQPESPLSLYDATIMYVSQQLMKTSGVQFPDHAIDPIRAAEAFLLARDHASPQEKKWFASLDQILPEDTATALFAQFAAAAISERFADHRMTMGDLLTIGTGREDGAPSLPDIRAALDRFPNAPIAALETGTRAIEAIVREPPEIVKKPQAPSK